MIRLQIPDMHCGACIRRVTRAVQSVDPAAQVEADAESARRGCRARPIRRRF
jgi:copper chaperone CopZ